mmetsp:Transcript_58127/g.52356  ORF Transcript_58127/g.52356 Transcript_58127/m.52356 type:complete len:105 (-) Transcript_58127:41-355(-)
MNKWNDKLVTKICCLCVKDSMDGNNVNKKSLEVTAKNKDSKQTLQSGSNTTATNTGSKGSSNTSHSPDTETGRTSAQMTVTTMKSNTSSDGATIHIPTESTTVQ